MWLQFGSSVFSILLLTSLTVAGENRLRFQRQSGLTLTQWPSNTINYYFDGLCESFAIFSITDQLIEDVYVFIKSYHNILHESINFPFKNIL